MIAWGKHDTRPLPEKPGSRDEAIDRGFDTASIGHDRTPVATDTELGAFIRGQARAIERMRDEDHEWRRSA